MCQAVDTGGLGDGSPSAVMQYPGTVQMMHKITFWPAALQDTVVDLWPEAELTVELIPRSGEMEIEWDGSISWISKRKIYTEFQIFWEGHFPLRVMKYDSKSVITACGKALVKRRMRNGMRKSRNIDA